MPWSTGTAVWGAGGFVFPAGVGGGAAEAYDEKYTLEGVPIGQQAKEALGKIKKNLEEFDTSLENITHVWYYIVGTDWPDGVYSHPRCQEAWQAIDEFWRENAPSLAHNKDPLPNTLIACTGLGRKNQLIEILVIAALPPLT